MIAPSRAKPPMYFSRWPLAVHRTSVVGRQRFASSLPMTAPPRNPIPAPIADFSLRSSPTVDTSRSNDALPEPRKRAAVGRAVDDRRTIRLVTGARSADGMGTGCAWSTASIGANMRIMRAIARRLEFIMDIKPDTLSLPAPWPTMRLSPCRTPPPQPESVVVRDHADAFGASAVPAYHVPRSPT